MKEMEASARVHQDSELLDTDEKLLCVTVVRLHSKEEEFSKFTYRLHKDKKKLNFDGFMEFLEEEMEKLQSVGNAPDLECCRKMFLSSSSIRFCQTLPFQFLKYLEACCCID